ncbi:MAG: aldolase/citrate lyase family protein [Planctomycetota bacterium]
MRPRAVAEVHDPGPLRPHGGRLQSAPRGTHRQRKWLGFDWVCVDLEHSAIGIKAMTDVFRGLGDSDCAPVARVPANDPVWIRRCLDAGVAAVIVPMVNSAADAEAAVDAARLPPRGSRGFGYCRANTYGVVCDGGDYRNYGWGRFSPQLRDVNGSPALRVGPELPSTVENLRIYGRALRTSEAIGNQRAGAIARW